MNQYFEVTKDGDLFGLLIAADVANDTFKENPTKENHYSLDKAYNAVEEILYNRYPDCFGWRAIVSPFDNDRYLVKIKG